MQISASTLCRALPGKTLLVTPIFLFTALAFGDAKMRIIASLLERNEHCGAVIASPTRAPHDYAKHWRRDGALVQRSRFEADGSRSILDNYVSFVRKTHELAGHGPLAVAKVNPDGTPFAKEWSLQSDGPALEAITFALYAKWLLDQELPIPPDLFESQLPSHSVLKINLEFIAHHWRESTHDVWEEVRGNHYYTRKVQRDALILGARICRRLGDVGASEFYLKQAALIRADLISYRNADRKFIETTHGQDGGSISQKTSNLDVTALLAANHGLAEDGLFGPQDSWVLATFLALKNDFAQRYAINAGKEFPLFGRYPEDRFNGVSLEPKATELGNPWFLTTFAASELLARSAAAFQKRGRLRIDAINVDFFNDLLRGTGVFVKSDNFFRAGEPKFQAIVTQLLRHARGYRKNAESYLDSNFHMAEQIDRDSGKMVGVEHLSWSYSAWLSARLAYRHASPQ